MVVMVVVLKELCSTVPQGELLCLSFLLSFSLMFRSHRFFRLPCVLDWQNPLDVVIMSNRSLPTFLLGRYSLGFHTRGPHTEVRCDGRHLVPVES